MVSIHSERQQKCLEYAFSKIQASPLNPYVKDLILFGSCARGQEKYASDVDLLIELDSKVQEFPKYKREIRLLRSDVSTDEVNDPEVDLKVYVGTDWQKDRHLFCQNVRKDGISIWR